MMAKEHQVLLPERSASRKRSERSLRAAVAAFGTTVLLLFLLTRSQLSDEASSVFNRTGVAMSPARSYKASQDFEEPSPTGPELSKGNSPARSAHETTSGTATLSKHPVKDNATPKVDSCNHTCVKTMKNVCLDAAGKVVRFPRAIGDIFRDSAVVFRFHGHLNPHHAIHEDGFPLFFEIRHCFATERDTIYFSSTGRSPYAPFFRQAAIRYIKSTGRWRKSESQVRYPDEKSDSVSCYRSVRFVLDPLRSPCPSLPEFASSPEALTFDKYIGRDGLGMRMVVQSGSGLVNVPSAERAAAFDLVREHMHAEFGWNFERSRKLLHPQRGGAGGLVNVVVVTRGKDVRKRRQTNGWKMARAIRDRFGSSAVNVSLFESRPELPLETQLRVFHDAEVVVAVHGGTLGNCFAMRPGTLLVTQCTRERCGLWESTLAPLVGVKVEQFDYNGYGGADDPVVNFRIEDILGLLEKHIDSRDRPHRRRK